MIHNHKKEGIQLNRKDIGGKDGYFFYLKFLWEGILSDVLTISKCKDNA